MILLYGCLTDPPLGRALEALQTERAPYILLAQSALDRERLRIEVDPEGVDGVLVSGGQEVALREIHSVYARPLELPVSSFNPADVPRAQQLHDQLFQWLDIADALVVNRPRAMEANGSKPLQAQLIGAAGFLVPETLVTSSEDEARAFWSAHGEVIFKSISGIRSIVQKLTDSSALRLHLISALPVQFQAYVPGTDVRVHVVGGEVFAAEIETTAVDYRYPARDGATVDLRKITLPPDLAQRCVALTQELGLTLAGIDLRRRPDGEYVCFEVNPMPAYSYFEAQTGLPISGALASLLIHGGRDTEVHMTQAVENMATIRGKIISRRPHLTLKEYDVVTLKLERADPVPDKANLLATLVGKEAEVSVLRTLLANSKAGQELRCRAKRTPDGAICEKDPAPGDFEVR